MYSFVWYRIAVSHRSSDGRLTVILTANGCPPQISYIVGVMPGCALYVGGDIALGGFVRLPRYAKKNFVYPGISAGNSDDLSRFSGYMDDFRIWTIPQTDDVIINNTYVSMQDVIPGLKYSLVFDEHRGNLAMTEYFCKCGLQDNVSLTCDIPVMVTPATEQDDSVAGMRRARRAGTPVVSSVPLEVSDAPVKVVNNSVCVFYDSGLKADAYAVCGQFLSLTVNPDGELQRHCSTAPTQMNFYYDQCLCAVARRLDPLAHLVDVCAFANWCVNTVPTAPKDLLLMYCDGHVEAAVTKPPEKSSNFQASIDWWIPLVCILALVVVAMVLVYERHKAQIAAAKAEAQRIADFKAMEAMLNGQASPFSPSLPPLIIFTAPMDPVVLAAEVATSTEMAVLNGILMGIKWMHIEVEVMGKQVNFRVNGKLIGTKIIPVKVWDGDGPIRVGQRDGGKYAFKGELKSLNVRESILTQNKNGFTAELNDEPVDVTAYAKNKDNRVKKGSVDQSYQFDGTSGCVLTCPDDAQPIIEEWFSISADIRPSKDCKGYIINKSTLDNKQRYWGLVYTSSSSGSQLQFYYRPQASDQTPVTQVRVVAMNISGDYKDGTLDKENIMVAEPRPELVAQVDDYNKRADVVEKRLSTFVQRRSSRTSVKMQNVDVVVKTAPQRKPSIFGFQAHNSNEIVEDMSFDPFDQEAINDRFGSNESSSSFAAVASSNAASGYLTIGAADDSADDRALALSEVIKQPWMHIEVEVFKNIATFRVDGETIGTRETCSPLNNPIHDGTGVLAIGRRDNGKHFLKGEMKCLYYRSAEEEESLDVHDPVELVMSSRIHDWLANSQKTSSDGVVYDGIIKESKYFVGDKESYLTLPDQYQPDHANLDWFSISVEVRTTPTAKGFIFTKNSPDNKSIYYGLGLVKSPEGCSIQFYYRPKTLVAGHHMISCEIGTHSAAPLDKDNLIARSDKVEKSESIGLLSRVRASFRRPSVSDAMPEKTVSRERGPSLIEEYELDNVQSSPGSQHSSLSQETSLRSIQPAVPAPVPIAAKHQEQITYEASSSPSKDVEDAVANEPVYAQVIKKEKTLTPKISPVPELTDTAVATALAVAAPVVNGYAPVDEMAEDLRVETYCYVTYDFEAEGAGEIALKEGEQVLIINKEGNGTGWWLGKNLASGLTGVFPSAYVEEVDEEDDSFDPAPVVETPRTPPTANKQIGRKGTVFGFD